MSATRFRLADRSDDAALRRLDRETAMDGALRTAFLHEPSFFAALEVMGRHMEVGICQETESRRVVAMGVRAIKDAYVNGEPASLGYLSSLRVAPDRRNGTLLARMYRQARVQHEDGRASLYVTTIIEDNAKAMEMLTSGRCGLPTYRDSGRFLTFAVGLGQRNPFPPSSDCRVRRATERDLDAIVRLLNEEGPEKQFFPVYTAADLASPAGLLRGLAVEDVLLAHAGRELVGVVALWDQTGFRQTLVAGYGGLLKLTRRAYNALTPFTGYPRLPRAGTVLRFLHLGLVCVRGNALPTFAALLSQAFDDAKRLGHSFFTIGLHERDTLVSAMKKAKCFRYDSRLFVAHWEDGQDDFERLDDRTPYLELGAL